MTGRADARDPHVRPLTVSTRLMVERGIAESPSFRALVERLNGSDVVVYITEDPFQSTTLAGRLTFLTAAGGYRYVRVRLHWRGHGLQRTASLAHELQHAVEIAERPEIVDEPSLAHAYRHLCHQPPGLRAAPRAFETRAAIEIGDRVWRELARRRDRAHTD